MGTVDVVDRLILGHMPFIGVSYQSPDRDREYRKRFSDANAIRGVIDAAVAMGVKVFAAAAPDSSPLAPLHLQVLRDVVDDGHEIALIPCVGIPLRIGSKGVDAFRRWATYLSVEERTHPGIRRRVLEDPILNFREGWKKKLPTSRPYDEGDLQRLSVDWGKIDESLEPFMEFPVSYMEPGSETDFLAMTGRFDLLGDLVDRIKERGFSRILFGVHHAGVTIPRLEGDLTGFDGYLTPLNPLGVMMLPTQGSAESAIEATGKTVFAIKPLAGGRVEPERAFSYVFGFDVEGCMIGCASTREVEEDVRAAVKAQKMT